MILKFKLYFFYRESCRILANSAHRLETVQGTQNGEGLKVESDVADVLKRDQLKRDH